MDAAEADRERRELMAFPGRDFFVELDSVPDLGHRVLLLGGSTVEHVRAAVLAVASGSRQVDLLLGQDKAASMVWPLDTGRCIAATSPGPVSLERTPRWLLDEDYTAVVLIVNNLHGAGYQNFIEVAMSFPGVPLFLHNANRTFVGLSPGAVEFLRRATNAADLPDAAPRTRRPAGSRPRVLVDATQTGSGLKTGIAKFVLGMVRSLCGRSELELVVIAASRETFEGSECTLVWGEQLSLPSDYARLVRKAVRAFEIDVFISPYSPAPRLDDCRTIQVVHDLIPLIHPEYFNAPKTVEHFDVDVRRACLEVDAIVADSESTRSDVIRLYGVSPEKVTTIYPGSPLARGDEVKPRQLGDPARPFYLYAGTIEPRKGVSLVLEAVASLREDLLARPVGERPLLVLAGQFGWGCEHERRRIAELEAEGLVCHLGYVSDLELAWLYRHAYFSVYPSAYEGFGLPILEAFVFGCAVITCRNSSLVEVAGDAALYCDPRDVPTLAAQIVRLLDDAGLRSELQRRGLEQASRFSWETFAAGFSELLLRIRESDRAAQPA